jgi:hypothetical protein
MSSGFLVFVCCSNMYTLAVGNKILSYSTSFKLKVLQYAGNMVKDLQVINLVWTNSALGNGVNKKKILENALKSKQAFHSKQGAFPRIKDELHAYVMDLRKCGYAVSTEMLQLEATRIAWKSNIHVTEFKASYGWVWQFLNHQQVLIHRRTTISQRLPE